ncbi:MAG: DUF4214 domain-containing protein [Labilithrix sp.]|nr:DUF4214 domain-containing protein [Labilithrix sp.]MCW5812351.1 DUF4214 domain-containing protein [Labilithrix sp.]
MRFGWLVFVAVFAAGCAVEDPSGTKVRGNGAVQNDDDDPSDPTPTDQPANGNDGVAPVITPSTPAQTQTQTPGNTPASPAKKPAIACLTDTDSVKASYFIALQRDPDPGGLQHWVGIIQAGESRLGVLKQILQSPEFIASREQLTNEDYVTSLYRSFFDREPDAAGFALWLDSLNKGGSRSGIALAFADSAEFKDPGSNRAAACYF